MNSGFEIFNWDKQIFAKLFPGILELSRENFGVVILEYAKADNHVCYRVLKCQPEITPSGHHSVVFAVCLVTTLITESTFIHLPMFASNSVSF